MVVFTSLESEVSVRKLRAWHWLHVMFYRPREVFLRRHFFGLWAHIPQRRADIHLRHVITLNDFFPQAGDTAEADCEKYGWKFGLRP